MRLHVDVREACRPRPAGKGVWTRGLLAELLRRPVDLVLHTDAPLPDDLAQLATVRPVRPEIVRSGGGFLWHLQTAWRLKRIMRPDDVYLSPTSFIVPALLGRSVPCVPVVHDLIAFRDDEHSGKARAIERLTLGRCLSSAKAVLTISAATRSDLLRRYPTLDPVRVASIFAGPLQASPPPARRDRAIILCIGTLCPRKNQLGLVRAFGRLPEDVRRGWTLVLAGGRGWKDEPILEAVRETPGAEWHEYVPNEKLEELLTHARLLAFPSFYEGFGLPVLDAFQRGLPVLCSNRGSLQELAGGTAFIVEPQDTAALARGLQLLMTDKTLADDLASRGPARASRYSWAKTADLALKALGAA
ncbi:MAG: glycosyltransferase family 4 protein [Candidatus Peribacteraceae bacterium]|nr:glycosyltransferase family 4 protein [Candidatus Peribacteraceae bacterium]